jgi:hypothetical protein
VHPPLKGTIARDFRTLIFFHQSTLCWGSNSYPKIFSISTSPNYSNSKFDWPIYIIAASKNFFLARRVLKQESPWSRVVYCSSPMCWLFLPDCLFRVKGNLSKCLQLTHHFFNWLTAIIDSGKIWLTATNSAVSFDWPPYKICTGQEQLGVLLAAERFFAVFQY